VSRTGKDGASRSQDAPSYVVATVVICLLLLVASTGVLVWSAVSADGADGTSRGNEAMALDAGAQQRKEVLELTEEFFVQANTYDSRALPDYKERVHPLLTPGFTETFDKTVDDVLAKLAETKLRSEAVFRVAAIKSMDQDSAEVLVAGNGSTRSTLVDRIFFPRWRVVVVRTDDGWRVDDYETVLGDGSTVVGQ
jgi:hypothetical protein